MTATRSTHRPLSANPPGMGVALLAGIFCLLAVWVPFYWVVVR